jgi:Secretion system C-terminal sorting domain
MKHLLQTILFVLLTGISFYTIAQCPTCSIDSTCVSTDGFPTICPATLPNATVGEYYEGFLTFYMPPVINDPGSGLTVDLLQITITSVNGLPFGIEYTVNDADNIFYPTQGELYGCATLCGIPILPGTYDVVISVEAIVSALGSEITQYDSFIYTIVVDPGAGGTSTFSYDNAAGCGSLDVQYQATVAGQPGQWTTYTWDFGNGTSSYDSLPAVVHYDAAGVYTCSLTTVISGNWGGDVDDFFSSPGDPYFTVQDANGNVVYTSTTLSNVSSGSWSGVNVAMTSPGYSITFWDADDVSADDDLGTIIINAAVGSQNFDAGNGTYGNVMVGLDEITNITSTADIQVFESPQTSIVLNDNVISLSNDTLSNYFWYQNGALITGENGSALTASSSGYYHAVVSNLYGCNYETDSVLYCAPAQITFNNIQQQLSIEDVYQSYQWFYNGIALAGATTYYIINPTDGVYAVEVTNEFGCTLMSNTWLINGVEEMERECKVFPNPAIDRVMIQGLAQYPNGELIIYDVLGQVVFKDKITADQLSIDLSTWSSGVYQMVVKSDHHTQRMEWMKR